MKGGSKTEEKREEEGGREDGYAGFGRQAEPLSCEGLVYSPRQTPLELGNY